MQSTNIVNIFDKLCKNYYIYFCGESRAKTLTGKILRLSGFIKFKLNKLFL